MIRRITDFFLLLTTVCVITGVIHYFLFSYIGKEGAIDHFAANYLFNYLFAFSVGIFLIKVKDKWPDQLGFAYLGGISLKFILFFIIIYPGVHQDGQVTRLEFVGFFIPFSVCLLTEILFLIRLLRN